LPFNVVRHFRGGPAVVNVNTATKEELTSLKGVGEKRAQEIINYRTKNGPFKTVDDLEKVPGIGPGIMKQIRSEVTTASERRSGKRRRKDSQSRALAEIRTAKARLRNGR
jgi:competence protein ComEA